VLRNLRDGALLREACTAARLTTGRNIAIVLDIGKSKDKGKRSSWIVVAIATKMMEALPTKSPGRIVRRCVAEPQCSSHTHEQLIIWLWSSHSRTYVVRPLNFLSRTTKWSTSMPTCTLLTLSSLATS
jgi:hypothetical protein